MDLAIANLGALLALVLLTQCVMAGETASMTVDVNQKHQVIEGFGASGAWWPSWVSRYPQEKQDQLLDLLYGERGIALSIYRYNIPAGGGAELRPERATAKIETTPGHYDLSADRGALEILRGVRRRGVERFVLFSNSPPARLTRSGMTSGGEGGDANLRPGEEEALADYLLDIATLVQREYDLPQVALSPINEPQWKWGEKWRGQEGCHYTPQQAAAVIRKVIDAATRRNLRLRIEAPESGAWDGTLAYAEAMFADPIIDRHVQEIAIHSYWTDAAKKREAAKVLREKFPAKRLVMSEYCEMKHGHELGIDSAIDIAAVIHDDLTIGDVISWQWWLGVAAGGYRDGLIYAHPETQKIEPTKRLWALGQYSRFVRPLFTRVHATTLEAGLKASAFLSPDGARLVCVIINTTDKSIATEIAIPGKTPRRRQVYVTDKDRDLAGVGAASELPPRSISTIVLDL